MTWKISSPVDYRWLNAAFLLFFFLQMMKNVVLQWGEMPTSVAFIGIGEIMGWGNKAIEIRFGFLSESLWKTVTMVSSPRSVETGHLDGVFMHKKAQKLKFLCERNDKVGLGTWNWIQIV